jgi:conjugal transfer ATP-binding protein TraC
MFNGAKDWLFGGEGSVTKDGLESLSQRDQLSDYLPWLFYSPDHGNFLNMDNTLGYIWECTPLSFASVREIKEIEGILRITMPKDTVMQFIFVADKDVKHILDAYQANKTRPDPLVQKTIGEYARWLSENSGRAEGKLA